jgi:single-stranded-DNA-specific exonuclease
MRDALERLDTLYPGLMLKFGGHAMAAGLSLEEARFEEFQRYFGELVTEWLDPALLQGEIVSDGLLKADEMTLDTAEMLRDAGPGGRCSRNRCLMASFVFCNNGWWGAPSESDG